TPGNPHGYWVRGLLACHGGASEGRRIGAIRWGLGTRRGFVPNGQCMYWGCGANVAPDVPPELSMRERPPGDRVSLAVTASPRSSPPGAGVRRSPDMAPAPDSHGSR